MSLRIPVSALLLLASGALACSRAVRVESGGEVIPASAASLPVGAVVEVKLDRAIAVKQSRVGDEFTARVTREVVAQDGSTVVPSGAMVYGRITAIEASSDPTRPSLVRLDFESLRFGGRRYPFEATVERTAIPGRTNEELLRAAGVGAVAGAVLGAVVGGGDLKDIVVGGAIGAAAGTLISLGTKSSEARLPAGTKLTLRNTQRVML